MKNWRTAAAGAAAAVSLLLDNRVASHSDAFEAVVLVVRCLAVAALGLAARDKAGLGWRTTAAGALAAIGLFFDHRVATGRPTLEFVAMVIRIAAWVSLGIFVRDREAPWRTTLAGIAAGVGVLLQHHVATGIPWAEELVSYARAGSQLALGWCAMDKSGLGGAQEPGKEA